jgi:NodT family efflux transporter outer membrane factor (OMF) lipoprotein
MRGLVARAVLRSHAAPLSFACVLGAAVVLSGCAVGPRYSRPSAQVPPAYKETPPDWKTAQPSDQVARGKWWELFADPQLNALEERIAVSNQNLKAAQAQFLEARAQLHLSRADYYPTATAGVSASRNRLSANRPLNSSIDDYTDLVLPVDVSYEADVWGRVRRTVEAARAQAQATAGDLESVNLSLHADLASDYFQLRSLDAEEQLLQSTVKAYQQALKLTEDRYHGGVASAVDVAQAQTQLESTRAQALDVGVQRAEFEHAIAVLAGEPASTFSLPVSPLVNPPPAIPPGLPSELLERRSDVAAAERRMAAANAQIGVAKAAYYPLLSLTGVAGLEGTRLTTWFLGPSAFASAGASAVVTVFDVGRRRAVSDQAKAGYDQTVANYRETCLTAFQEVEDNLAALRILADEAATQDAAVAAAEHSLELSTNRYKGGVANYLEVTTAQSAALTDQRVAVEILGRRVTSAVLLIKALGGGWDRNRLPSAPELNSNSPMSDGHGGHGGQL